MAYLEEAKSLKNKREEYLERYAAYMDSLTRKKVKDLVEELVKERKERGISRQEIADSGVRCSKQIVNKQENVLKDNIVCDNIVKSIQKRENYHGILRGSKNSEE